MGTQASRKSKPLWQGSKYLVWVAVFSALLGALVNVMDTLVINKGFLDLGNLPDGFAITTELLRINILAYLILGSWVGILVNVASNHTVGKWIEGSFTREHWVSNEAQASMFATGLLAAICTLTQIYVATGRDPSYLIALSGVNIVWIVLYELIWKRRSQNLVKKMGLIAITILGSVLTSVDSATLGTFRWTPVLLMTLVVGITMAASRVIETEKCKARGGVVNFNFWRFFWLAVSGTTISLTYSALTSTLPLLLDTLISRAPLAITLVLITMVLAYGNNLLRIYAQRHTGNTSRVAVILSSQAIFAVPFGIFAWKLLPEIYSFPNEPSIWLLRALGVLMVLTAVILLEQLSKKNDDE